MTEMYSYSQGGDGVEYLYIPVDSATLKQFIEDQQNNNVGWRLCFSVILKIPWNQLQTVPCLMPFLKQLICWKI